MSTQANKTLIGGFVIGAVALIVAGILIFGSGRFFREKNTFIVFFSGSVQGLNVGAPVKFRGVQVGEVREILMSFNPNNLQIEMPVIIEIVEGKVGFIGPHPKEWEHTPTVDVMKMLIDKGMRAQLQTQSFVTGQLFVNLDYYPGHQPRYLTKIIDVDFAYPEIPTIPSGMAELAKKIENIQWDEIAQDIHKAVQGFERIVNSPDLKDSITEFKDTLMAFKTLAQNVDKEVKPLSDSIRGTMDDAGKLVQRVDRHIDPLAADVQKTVKVLRAALEQAEQTLQKIEKVAVEGSQLRYDISETLREVGGAARSVRFLADFLEQNPDALLRGRVSSGGEQ